MKTRDIQLDIYRALAMIYIPCVIHTAFWLGLIPDPFRSLILFEMPVVFFISGASLSGRSAKSLRNTFVSRFKRVLLPYYIYFTVYILFIAVASLLTHNVGVKRWLIYGYIIPQDIGLYYCNHLWFIIPYIIIAVSFPLQCKLIDTLKWKYLLLNLFVLGCVMAINGNKEIQEIVGYNIFFVTGYLYYRKLSVKQIAMFLFLTAILMFGAIMIDEKPFIPMQSHKFPPDFVFIFFGLMVLCVFGLLFSKVKMKSNQILDIWNKRGYTIYLYQNFVFVAMALMLEKVPVLANSPLLIRCIVSSVMIFVMSTLLSYPMAYMELKCVNAITSIYRWFCKKYRSNLKLG